MKYDTSTISAKPGETLHIVLKNAGTMPKIAMAHNVVILKPGTDGSRVHQRGHDRARDGLHRAGA